MQGLEVPAGYKSNNQTMAVTTPTKGANTIEGDQEFTIRIRDVTTADAIAEKVKKLGKDAAKITSIHIDTTSYFQALDEQEKLNPASTRPVKKEDIPWPTPTAEEFEEAANINTRPSGAPPDPDPRAAAVCRPLIDIHNAILNSPNDGNLKTYSWPAPNHTDRHFTRPNDFWSSLYCFDTLEYLHLDFFCHEVDEVTQLASAGDPSFPELRTLRLDTSSAHGDDGTAIDQILHGCPNIESLHFEWPPCDLNGCQIKNISWTWTFPKLHSLTVYGWNIAPAAYTDFLVRHPGIKNLEERVDGPYEEEGKEYASMHLPGTALPDLRTLKKEYTGGHRLRDYFNLTASRPIRHLTLHARSYQGAEQELLDITTATTAQTNLRALEFLSEIRSWRDEEPDSDSSDDEDETTEQRQVRKEQEEQHRQERATRRLPHILKTVLPSFTNLNKLTIEMDSSNGTWDSTTKDFITPAPMGGDDLVKVLALLLKSPDCNLKLLRLRDKRAKPLDGTVGISINKGEIDTGSLMFLIWDGERKEMVTLPAGKEAATRAENSDANWD